MIERDKTVTDTSLQLIALIKYEFVQAMKINESAKLISKKELEEKLEQTQSSTAKMLTVFQLMNSDLSYSKSIELLCEWINNNELLVKSVENMFEEKTFIEFYDELTSEDLESIKEIHDDIIDSMNITFKKEMLNSLIEKAKIAEKEDQ